MTSMLAASPGRAARLTFLIAALLICATGAAQEVPSPAVPEPAAQCYPACREGYFCSQGQCMSRCNPPCEAGTICTNQGQCALPAPATPYAAPPPAYPAYPPPVVDRREQRRLVKEQRRAQAEERRQERIQQLEDEGYRGRVYAGAHLTLQGMGLADNDDYDFDSETGTYGDGEVKHAVGAQLGIDLGFEFRMSMVFGLGPGLRYQRITYRDTDIVDLTINPTFHVPLGVVELVFPISAGLALAWDDHAEPGDGPLNSDGAGFAIGVMPGMIFWPVRNFGIYFNVGLTAHLLSIGYYQRFYTTAGNLGVTFAY